MTIPLVVFGIALSVLHQSSLGTLFAIMPHRLHPLFYTPIINVQFFVSCVAMGLAAVIVESYIANLLYGRRISEPQLQQLGRFLSWVVWLFIAIRLIDLAVRGDAVYLLERSWSSFLFWFEMVPLLLVPSALLQWRRVTGSRTLLGLTALTVVIGFILNRMSVAGLATIAPTGTGYVPSPLELLMSLGLVPGIAVLIWMFLVENYQVWEPEPELDERDRRFSPPSWDPPSGVWLGDSPIASFKRYSLAFVFGAATTFALLPKSALFGASATSAAVHRPRGGRDVLLIDGNRADEAVLFDHRKHEDKLGAEESCLKCHHMVVPYDRDTPCWCCHRDMWSPTVIFRHDWHVATIEQRGHRNPCVQCHQDATEPKSGKPAAACSAKGCHQDELALVRRGSRVAPEDPDRYRAAAGYMDALHGLCIDCHKERAAELERPHHGDCATCHRERDAAEIEDLERRRGNLERAAGGET